MSCSYCGNKPIMIDSDGEPICKKCRKEELSFLFMTPKERDKLLQLYQKELELSEQLLQLEKKQRGLE